VRCRERWRSTCTHKGGRGRCLVIDPFCATADTGIVAVRWGRQYLGIDPNPANVDTARRRLAKLLERAR
jgi:DNA modification methylase